jgi:hypothetical protein
MAIKQDQISTWQLAKKISSMRAYIMFAVEGKNIRVYSQESKEATPLMILASHFASNPEQLEALNQTTQVLQQELQKNQAATKLKTSK